MSSGADISVVMAVRNAGETLPRALQSLCEQSLSPREILLVLNGCQDRSAQIARDFASSDPRIQILESSLAGGVAEAAQVGCAHAQSPLLARMDADDYAHPHRLRHQLDTLQENQADLVTCTIASKDSLGAGLERFVDWANTLCEPEDFRRERFIESPVVQPGVLMKKDRYLAAGGYQVQDGPEDYDLWLRLLENGARFFQASHALLDWHDSANRLTRSHQDYSESQMMATKAHYLARLDQVKEKGVALSGTGPIGRRLAKLLLSEKVLVHGFFDVDPRKIGRTALDLPVKGPADLGKAFPEAVLLGCVGRGGRERVRQLAQEAHYREGEDFFACC